MKKPTKLLLIILCLTVVNTVSAQEEIFAPPRLFDTKVEYKKTVTTYFTVEKNAPITNLDKNHIRASQKTQLIKKYYKDDGSKPTILITPLASNRINGNRPTYPSIPIGTCETEPPLERLPSYNFKIDETGISAFDAKGNFIKKQAPSKEYLDMTS